MVRQALANLTFAFAVREITARSSLFRLSPQSCHPYPRFCLRHENLFPFADLVMCVITSRRDLVQLQPNLPLWKQRNVRLMCLSLATVYRGESGESQINYDTAKARETLASMSRGHVSIGFCMTILFAIKIYAYSLYLFFFFYAIFPYKMACISHPLAISTKWRRSLLLSPTLFLTLVGKCN